jgi:hypothetical protein
MSLVPRSQRAEEAQVSLCLCQFCGSWIDSDDDPECIYDTDTQRDVIACETCRETPAIEHELNHRANEADMALKDFA